MEQESSNLTRWEVQSVAAFLDFTLIWEPDGLPSLHAKGGYLKVYATHTDGNRFGSWQWRGSRAVYAANYELRAALGLTFPESTLST